MTDQMNILEKLANYMQYPFVRYALIVGLLIALCSSLIGVTLVLKRFSFIGDGLSHVAFGAMAVASVLKIADKTVLILPVTLVCAILLLRCGQNAKIKGDAMIAMISVGALAFGYLLMNLFATSSNLTGDVCSTLFGSTSILTLSQSEVIVCAILSVVVLVFFIIFYNKIFSVTFDENFSRASGLHVDIYNTIISIIVALIVVLAMNLVGSLLISALIIFPALSSMRVFKSFKAVTICSAIISVACAFFGIIISILAGTPVGSTIVAMNVAIFALFSLIEAIPRAKLYFLPVTCLLICLCLTGCKSSSLDGNRNSKESTTKTFDSSNSDNSESSNSGYSTSNNSDYTISNSVSNESSTGSSNSKNSDKSTNSKDSSSTYVDEVEDLSTLSSTMIYAKLYDMICSPDDYLGKVIILPGTFDVYEFSGNNYYVCTIADATACCNQSMEFVLRDQSLSYPDDYPEIGTSILVSGRFETYEEDGSTYCHLADAVVRY